MGVGEDLAKVVWSAEADSVSFRKLWVMGSEESSENLL